jgi:mannobiose 2-epimerase
MKAEIKKELTERIIPFWNSIADFENGGFYGYVADSLQVDKGAFKGSILHSRILWFYSNCYLVLKDENCLKMAKHCYDFMVKYFLDRESGGVFWSVNVKGMLVNPMKHGYCNAFFIYALASFYAASGDKTALNNAMRVFEVIETEMVDEFGYRESCDRDWNEIENDELSENGIKADRTMNTVLHLIEAYTELYRVSNNEDVLGRLRHLLELAYTKVYNPAKMRLEAFFDNRMNVIGDVHSYGHDAEAGWLIGRALDIAGESAIGHDLYTKLRSMNKALFHKVDEVAFADNGAMFYESVGQGAHIINPVNPAPALQTTLNKRRVWWAQTEGVVGFLYAYGLYGEQRYLERAVALWAYIKENFIDKRAGGEWFSELDENDVVDHTLPVVDEWKCPYHNGRMCLMCI